MKLIIGIFFLLNCIVNFPQSNDLTGTYSSVNNEFERWSNMTLNDDLTFNYNYGVGGCQGNVTGTYFVNGSTLELINDSEFLNDSIPEQQNLDSLVIDANDSLVLAMGRPIYPNLGLTNWKIGRNFIKPLDEVDSGCLQVTEKHKRE